MPQALMELSGVILSKTVEKDVGSIIGVLVKIIAVVMNVIYNFISLFTEKHSLGLAIIVMTFVIRLLMVPQGISTQKSQIKMRKVQPEIDKIKKKYGDSKDPEIQRKISMETQAVYQEHKINMFGGCLPLLITLPIFYALIDLMRRLYIYVDKINELYIAICNKLYEIPNIAEAGSALWNIAVPKVPQGMKLDIRVADDLVRFIDTFTKEEWAVIKSQVTDSKVLEGLNELLIKHDNIQHFLGINLVETVGLQWPGIVIPVLSAATSFLLSFLSTKMGPQNQDASAKMNQRIMMLAMPVMMFFFTLNVSGGVGVYWIAGNVFAMAQQYVLNKIYMKKDDIGGKDIVGKAKEKSKKAV